MLDKGIESDGKAYHYGSGNDAVELPLGAQALEHEKKDDYVGEGGVGPLQPLVASHETDLPSD